MTESTTPVDLDKLRTELVAGLEQLATHLLGEPSIRKAKSLRWGRKGSLEVVLTGRKRGAWIDRESGVGGGPLQLVMHARSCTLPEAIRWARDWTGHAPDAGRDYKAERAARQAEQVRRAREAEAEDRADAEKRVAYARRLWAGSMPLAGTVGERYVTIIRGVADRTWPDAVRFDPHNLALIVAATDDDGAVQAVQRVHLTPNAMKAAATETRATKHTTGRPKGAAVRLPGPVDGPLLLAEGPETALHVWAATGHETWIGLGSVGNIVVPAGRRVLVCRDDDPRFSPAEKAHNRVLAGWRAAGLVVAVATPWAFRRFDKSDFADVGLQDGAEAIRARIWAALHPGGGPPQRLPILQVRRELAAAVAGFFDAVRDYDASQDGSAAFAASQDAGLPNPDEMVDAMEAGALVEPEPVVVPVHGIKADVGSGKSVSTYAAAVHRLIEMRRGGDKRAAAFLVPRHDLGDEQALAFGLHARGTDLTARVWRGMSADDPDAPGEKMCRRLDAVDDAREAMTDVYASCCRRKLSDGTFAVCPFFNVCGYERQRRSKADVWIGAHELAFIAKPEPMGQVAFVVADESMWADGLVGVGGKPQAMALDALTKVADGPDRERLTFLRNRLVDVLRGEKDGPVRAAVFATTLLTVENLREARGLERMRHVDPVMHPVMSPAQRKEAVARAYENRFIPQFVRVWDAVEALLSEGGPEASGWIALAEHQDPERGPVRVLHLKGRQSVKKGWQVPTLLLDALLDADLVRPYWPQVEVTCEALADAPHQHVRQVVDRAYSKSALDPMTPDVPGYSPEEAARRQRNLRSVHAVLNREARRYDEAPVLVVAQKAVREALPSFGPMAPYIDLAHHNAVAGRDEWWNVRALLVVGRTQPAPASVERMAEALTGRAVERLPGWYRRGDAVRHTANGAVAIDADRHPDPICEAIRWQVCEGELVQIVGRARGVNRTEDDPVDVLVLTDAPLPIPVEATLSAADLVPRPDDFMLAAGGVVFENPTDAAVAYPQLWSNRDAAKKAFQRARLGTIPYKEILLGDCPQPRRAEYQRAGAGQKPSTAWVDSALVPDPEAKLTELLGALAWCQSATPDPPPPSNAPRPDREPVPPLRPGGEVSEGQPAEASSSGVPGLAAKGDLGGLAPRLPLAGNLVDVVAPGPFVAGVQRPWSPRAGP